MKIKCLDCGKFYKCNFSNTRVYGPIIETTCSECGKLLIKNYSSFVESQFKSEKNELYKATLMIKFAQYFSERFVDDRPKKRKK